MTFEWDDSKNHTNIKKHGVSFQSVQEAFFDIKRIILEDDRHSETEKRHYCIGKVFTNIVTVRFTYRKNKIRIIGAGFWREGRRIYEKKNKIH
ncbi:BrnT family toxin [Spirochaetota bacterium]